MTQRPQTIQIFLPHGDPRGLRVAEITTRIVRVIEVPRSELASFLTMAEAQQVGVYFLVEEGSEAGLSSVYIGQSGSVGIRLTQHNQDPKKDFWNKALVVVSLTNSITQTHALFLEWYAISQAMKVGRCRLENGNSGARPHTPAPLEADCHEIHETASVLLATLGYPIFEPLSRALTPAALKRELFYCKGQFAAGTGEYTNEGLVVHKDSKARLTIAESLKDTSTDRLRERLINEGILKKSGDSLVFTRDYLFASPSAASDVLTGRSSNGWIEWKNADGKTLDDVKRQPFAKTLEN